MMRSTWREAGREIERVMLDGMLLSCCGLRATSHLPASKSPLQPSPRGVRFRPVQRHRADPQVGPGPLAFSWVAMGTLMATGQNK